MVSDVFVYRTFCRSRVSADGITQDVVLDRDLRKGDILTVNLQNVSLACSVVGSPTPTHLVSTTVVAEHPVNPTPTRNPTTTPEGQSVLPIYGGDPQLPVDGENGGVGQGQSVVHAPTPQSEEQQKGEGEQGREREHPPPSPTPIEQDISSAQVGGGSGGGDGKQEEEKDKKHQRREP